ncbi:MAG: TlpA family protein disulfide reductase [Cyclobacteriaceae bacterium]|nr:TlpA family protein disulfide reductase [Cyclobacteriaceae bacterium]
MIQASFSNTFHALLFALFVTLMGCNSTNNKEINQIQSQSQVINQAKKLNFSDLELIDLNGNKIKLNPNKTSFINLWATWCTPCIREMPSIQLLQEKLGDKMDFYIASYEEIEKVKRFAENTGTVLPFYSYNADAIPDTLDTQLLPFTVIVKGEEVLFSKTGGTKWHEGPVFEEILNVLKHP